MKQPHLKYNQIEANLIFRGPNVSHGFWSFLSEILPQIGKV